nr:hypothetical protein [Deltaproteobacteria bacterium]
MKLFVTQGKVWQEWRAKGAAAKPWGDDTEARAGPGAEMDPKLEAYFIHCELLRTEAPSPESLRLKDDDLRALRLKAIGEIELFLQGAPLSAPRVDGALPLDASVNELYRDRFEALRDTVIRRALGAGATALSRADWRKVKATFDGYTAWEKAKPAEPFDKLGDDKMKAYLDGGLPAKVEAYIALDLAAAKRSGRSTTSRSCCSCAGSSGW